MALGAMEHVAGLQVRVVPVGLSYFHPHRFRSRAVVEFGQAVDIPQELVDQFRQGGNDKRKATGKLLDMIYDALKTVTIRAPDYETLMVRFSIFVCPVHNSNIPGNRLSRLLVDYTKHRGST